MKATPEKLDHLIFLLEHSGVHVSMKEQVYLEAMKFMREHQDKKPVQWARRIKPSLDMGFSEEWASPSGYLRENDPEPDGEGQYEYKPLYDK